MSRGVQPKKVAPLIRGARYTLLVAGWFYGSEKKKLYMKIEETERVKREAAYTEEKRLKALKEKESTINEFKSIFSEIGYDPEPNWEDSVVKR